MAMFQFRPSRPPAPRGPRGCRVYAVGDVHGRLDLLDQLLGQIDQDIASRSRGRTAIVFLGDLIDRGPDSCGVIERLRTYRRPGVRPIFLLGNHEEVLLRLLAGERNYLSGWLRFGGAECLRSYGSDPESLPQMSPRQAVEVIRRAIPADHAQFLSTFGDSFRFGDYLFVHAGIQPGVPLEQQRQADLRWVREPFLQDQSDHGFVVVHGHTIRSQVDEQPNRIGIDTGAYRTGVLTAVAIEGANRWYISTLGQSRTADPQIDSATASS